MLRVPLHGVAPGQEARVRTVMDALRRIVRDLRLSGREVERRAGISGAQLFVLQTLAHGPATSLNDLAVRTLTDQSSVSVVVRRLVDKKLVTRTTSAADARRIELSVTAAGRRLLARCPEPTQARLVSALKRVTSTELVALTHGLSALVREMGIEAAEPRMFFEEALSPRVRRGKRSAARDGA